MSLYVQWINLIKENADYTWLSDRQRDIYDRLLTQWRVSPFVSIHGPSGSGKSFIARLLAKEHGYLYLTDLDDGVKGAEQVIIDDAHYTRMMRPRARELEIARVVLFSPRPAADPMPGAELRLDAHDIQQIMHTLYERCGFEFSVEPQGTDVGEILRAEAIARGGQ
jgi:ABC-type cobalamin/Fe3+-siderophores transport system ATPase subunit